MYMYIVIYTFSFSEFDPRIAQMISREDLSRPTGQGDINLTFIEHWVQSTEKDEIYLALFSLN